ncbi:MAG: TolC family protein [Bdellovibrio sp.]|nr:MAG: TolC family protein [Bdellovibrio sp.]
MPRKAVFVLFLAITGPAHALTLAEALEAGLQNSPKLQKSEAALEAARSRYEQSSAGDWPTLTGSVNYLLDKKYAYLDFQLPGSPAPLSIPQIIPTTVAELDARYALFDGFITRHHRQAAESLVRAAEDDVAWTRFQLQRSITLQFYRALGAQALRQVSERNLSTIEDHLRDVGLFKRAGLSTQYDVLRVEVQASEAKSDLMNAIDNIEIAKGELSETLGLEESKEPAGELPVLTAGLIQDLHLSSLEERRDLQALQHQRDSLTDEKKSVEGSYWPRLSLMGQYQYYNNRTDGFNDTSNFRDAFFIGLQLNWALFDGFSTGGRVKEIMQEGLQTEKNLRLENLKAKQNFDIWRRKYLYNCSLYSSRLNDIEKASESVRLAQEGRKVGSRTNSDLLDAESELFRARAGAVYAQVSAIEALINLELASGKNLFPSSPEKANPEKASPEKTSPEQAKEKE